MAKLRRICSSILSSSLTALVLTALSIAIAITGSVSSISLKCSFPIILIQTDNSCPTSIDISSDPVLQVFWITLAVFAPLFLARELAIAAKTKRKERDLVDTIRTMPPSTVMQTFAEAYRNIINFVETNVDQNHGTTEEKLRSIDDAIRLALDFLASLASNLHQLKGQPRYAANVMTYIAADSVPDTDKHAILQGMERFLETPTFEGLHGILYLQTQLSSSTDKGSSSFAPDPSLVSGLAIPIPKPHFSSPSKRPRFLPGAATAFIRSDHLINDTHALLYEFENSKYWSEIPRSVFEKIDRYFREEDEGSMVRSFISIRIMDSAQDNADPLGVVNIHCNEPDIFISKWVYDSYLGLSAPIIWTISDLLKKRKKYDVSAA